MPAIMAGKPDSRFSICYMFVSMNDISNRSIKPRTYWIAVGIYAIYSVVVLAHWIVEWEIHHGLKRWRLGGWWFDMLGEMIIPTFPASTSIFLVPRLCPHWFLDWLAKNELTAMIMTWVWLTVVGFLQWFIVVLLVWRFVRRKPI